MSVEKVHLVWSPSGGVRRLQSKIYILCAITVGLYTVAIAVMVIGESLLFSPFNIVDYDIPTFQGVSLS